MIRWSLNADVETCKKIGSCQFFRAHPDQVIGVHLAIDHGIALFIQPGAECCQGHLGPIACAAEHGFAKEHPTERDAIKTADQLIVLPDFYLLGVSLCVERRVRRFLLRQDPGAVGVTWGRGAAVDVFGNILVVGLIVMPGTQGASHASGDV
mgnify:CR=1 FL=1